LTEKYRDRKFKIEMLLARAGLLFSSPPADLKPVFIVSTGRTGTQFLAEFFDHYQETMAFHEPSPSFLRKALKYVRGEIPFNKMKILLQKRRLPYFNLAKRKGCNYYIEANNRLFPMLAPLEKAFPEARVIHIVRDGRDYVRSGMSRNWYTEEDETRRLKSMAVPEDPWHEEWHSMSRFEKICWRWQKKNEFIAKNIDNFDHSLTVKFEDIFHSNDNRGLRRIADFIGLDSNTTDLLIEKLISQKINANKRYEIPKWTEWSLNRQKAFDKIAGSHMRQYYNYEWN